MGLALVKEEKREGFINKKGSMLIKYNYDDTTVFREGLAAACIHGKDENEMKYGFINKQGKFVIKPKFNFVWSFHEGLAVFQEDFLYGFINKKGEIVIKPQFTNVDSFSEGLARVQKNNKWGFIKNPLTVSWQAESLEKSGQLIGDVKSVSGNEITVGGKNIAERVMMGDKLCLYADEKLVILRSTFPMQTITKCEIISGNIKDIKPGMKVYKYRRDKMGK